MVFPSYNNNMPAPPAPATPRRSPIAPVVVALAWRLFCVAMGILSWSAIGLALAFVWKLCTK